MKLDDIIPDSISALVYKMRHPWLWTLGMWAVAFLGCFTMIPYNESYAGVAFASCAWIESYTVIVITQYIREAGFNDCRPQTEK